MPQAGINQTLYFLMEVWIYLFIYFWKYELKLPSEGWDIVDH